MKYYILIYENEDGFRARTDPARAQYMAAFRAYGEALRAAGVMVGGAPLQPPETATTVRVRDGKRHVQDGPYAETKEQLGGYVIIDVPDLDAALDWAARCPGASFGTVEVRPEWAMPGAACGPA